MSSFLLPSSYLFANGPVIKHTDPAWFRFSSMEDDWDTLEREEASYAASLAAIRKVAAPKPIGLGTTNSTVSSTSATTSAAAAAAAAAVAVVAAAGRGDNHFLADSPSGGNGSQHRTARTARSYRPPATHPSYTSEREDHPSGGSFLSTPGSLSGNTSVGSRAGDVSDHADTPTRRRTVRVAPRITYTNPTDTHEQGNHPSSANDYYLDRSAASHNINDTYDNNSMTRGSSTDLTMDAQRSYGETLEMIYGDEAHFEHSADQDDDDDMDFDDSYDQVYRI
jgi:hypothetical protein